MTKLDKKQLAEKERHAEAIRSKLLILEKSIDAYNEALTVLLEPILAARDELNDAVGEAETFRCEISDMQDAYYSAKSERWQEGGAGSDYSNWLDCWSNELEAVDVEMPEPCQLPDCEAADVLEGLPETP